MMNSTTVNNAALEPLQVAADMCEIVGIRHGLTDYNLERRLQVTAFALPIGDASDNVMYLATYSGSTEYACVQGRLDIPINDTGRRQCYECGLKLK